MRKIGLLALLGMVPVWAGEMPEKAADYHAALVKRPESAQLFDRFRDAWLEERSVEDLEKELLARAGAKEAGAWATLARAYLAAGKTEQALEAFDKARAQAPAAWLDLEAAKLRMALKDFAAAEKNALAVPEGDPMRSEALKLAGLACLRGERIEEALAYWTKAVAAAPGDNGLLEDLTELTRREGRFDLALDYCGKWRDATNDAYGKAMATLRRSELLLGSQRFDEAMTELAAVLEVSADDSWLERETLARAEQAHRQRGNSTGWAKWIGAQAEAHPSRLNFLRTSAQALAAAGKTDEALEVLTQVMKRSPGDVTVRWQRIGLLEQSMKLAQAYEECAELAAKEKSETAGLRLAELAFRLEKKDELKRALDGVLAAADPVKRVGLAGLYARYGLPEGSERIWREEAGGEQGGQALRQLAKHLKTAGRDKDAIDVWKQLGAREVAQDRMESAQMLTAAGERGAAREILMGGREKFSAEPGYEAALADLAMADEKADEARAIYLKLARAAKRPDELTAAAKGWLRASSAMTDPLKDLGDETADRCLRAAWLASAGKPLPPVRDGDETERTVRQALLREQGRWGEVVTMMEAVPGERGPLFLSELAEAKTAAGDLAGALAVTQAWRARVPDQAGPWLFEAGTLEKLGKQSEATVLLRRAAARFEDNEDIARRLFLLLQNSLDPRESLEWAWKRHDRSAEETVRTGWLREILQVSKQREQLDDLQARFEERARRDPASPGPLMALAELAKARGDSQAQLDFLRRAAVNAPRDTAVISALALLEEQSGETARALERHAALARLAPGPESAKNLAQAKIRLGDIEGGMRDMQTLAGEKGIDLRALEQTAGDLASRGYVGEAIRMITAVDPAQRTARLEFVLGTLLDADGWEMDAVDAFIRVMTEPDDPAEAQQRANYGYGYSRRSRQYSQILQVYSGGEERMPGVFPGLQVPQSLLEAQIAVKTLLSRLAMQRGGEIWQKVAKVVPELTVATPEQWREAMDFMQSGQQSGRVSWWEFIRSHPANPLGVVLLDEYGTLYEGKPDQVEALLKTNPPLLIRMRLRWGRGEWRADNPEFLESIGPDEWQDEQVRGTAVGMAMRMSYLACQEGSKPPVTAADCSRVMAVLEKVGFTGADAILMELLKARLALLEGKKEDFLKHLAAWEESARKPGPQGQLQVGYGAPQDTFEFWRKKAGDAAAEELLGKITSPLLRCQLANDPKPGQRLARVKRELAALPQDAPVETRRGLVRMSWSLVPREKVIWEGDVFFQQGGSITADLREELEAAAADEADPRLAFEAMIQLLQYRRNGRAFTPADRLKFKELSTKLAASADPTDQMYATQYAGYFGTSPRRNTPAVVTRWGASANGFSSGSYGGGRTALPTILAMEDKAQALREAVRLLESTARAYAGRPDYLRDLTEALAKAGLLDDALARISLPPEASLGRRVALITLFDACSKEDRSRALLAEIAVARPWETWWTVSLALHTSDDAEMRRLLDSVAERADFDRTLGQLLAPQNQEKPGELLVRLNRLADWAPQAKGRRAWMATVMRMLVSGGRGGLQELTHKIDAQLECYRRYTQLALEDRRMAECGFRMISSTREIETPAAVTDAARRVLFSGAYASEEQILPEDRGQENVGLSALEHLLRMAAENGDEAAFPVDFRDQLKAADPETAAWLAKLLAAKTVTELPDISTDRTKSSGWIALARHNAAVLRAASLPGRDAWLTEIFHGNKYQTVSNNLRFVVRASLLEARKKKTLPERVSALLEAAAGPRKDWWKKVPPNEYSPALAQLQQAAESILNAAVEADPATLLAVLDHFREARVPVSNSNSVFYRLSATWRTQSQRPETDALSELLGKRSDAPYTLGIWQWQGYGGQPVFQWALPQLLENYRSGRTNETLKKVMADPNAGFLDLFQASISSGDVSLRRRALLKAAPDLVKLPAEIRNPVIDYLSSTLTDDTTTGLPAVVSSRMAESIAARRKQSIALARESLGNLQSGMSGSSNPSQQYGSLLGQVIGEDDAFTAEVLAAWKPIAEADKSGRETEAFASGLISNTRGGLKTTLAILRLLDSLWKDSPVAPRNPRSGDPLASLWSRLTPENRQDPALWKQIAALSPDLQARIWLSSFRYFGENLAFTADSKLMASLREAAKGGEVTRAALEWMVESTRLRNDDRAKMDAGKLLGFVKALKNAGVPVADISVLLSGNYAQLLRMENPGILMAETPALLAGSKAFPAEQGGQILRSVQELWERARNDRRKNGAENSETALPDPVYPVETAALLKFIFSRGVDVSRGYVNPGSMTQMVLSLNEPDLLEMWVKAGGKSLVGDIELVIALLERNRVPEAIALAPAAGQEIYFRRRLFTRHLESLVAKLHADPSPPAFRLAARLSMLRDAYKGEAPAEKLEDRRKRLLGEFERVRSGLPVADRAALCLLFGLDKEAGKNIPALDEFASEQAAREFKALLTGESTSPVARLFVPAVFSRVHAGDLSGIDRLTSAITSVPAGRIREGRIIQGVIYPVHAGLVGYIGRPGAKMTPAELETILACVKVLAATTKSEQRGMLSQLVHFVATDAASLDAGLKRCGLDGEKPTVIAFRYFPDHICHPATWQTMLRLALLHPFDSDALMESLYPLENRDLMAAAFLPALADPEQRARLSPAIFLRWTEQLMPYGAENLKLMRLYADERRGDFTADQREDLPRLLGNW